MKKLGLAVAVASALGVSSQMANAYTVATYANGLLVPYASFTSTAVGTVVGLISCRAGNVHWVFLDEDSNHIRDDDFPVTKNDMYSFSLASVVGAGLAGQEGYLIFTLDEDPSGTAPPNGQLDSSDTACLAGNAFQVNLPDNDVAFVPTAPIYYSEYNHGNGITDIRFMGRDTITALAAGAQLNETIAMRYFADGATGGDDTNIYVWTVCKPPASSTAIMYDDEQEDASVIWPLPEDELNVINPEDTTAGGDIIGSPIGIGGGFIDGFITWDVAAAPNPSSSTSTVYCDHTASDTVVEDSQAALSYSIISAPIFGAVQTLYNPHSHLP